MAKRAKLRPVAKLVGLVTLGLVVMLPCAALAQSGNSEVGTWRLNLAKSKFVQGVAPKSQTIRIAASGAGIMTVMDTVESDGRVRHFEATQDYDGKDNLRRATDGKQRKRERSNAFKLNSRIRCP